MTLNHPVAGVMSLRFEASNGSATDIPLSTSDAAAMVEAVRQALGAASYEHHPDESSDTAAQILSFQCECDPETQMIVLRFEAQNRSPIVVTLPTPRVIAPEEHEEIEVSRQMIEAGEGIILSQIGGADLGGHFSAREMAKQVYLAMRGLGRPERHEL